MAFRVPTFNLSVSIFTNPGTGPARVVTMGNLRYGLAVNVGGAVGGTNIQGFVSSFVTLLLPALTDVRDLFNASGQDVVEVPTGSGRKYVVDHVEDIGKGFTNEHRSALLYKLGPWPTPIP